MPNIAELLRKGIAAAKAGQDQQARDLLTQVIDQDEGNEQAWLWLSSVVESLDDRRLCLENVVAINPGNVHAQVGLRQLEGVVTPPLGEEKGEGEKLEQGTIPPSPRIPQTEIASPQGGEEAIIHPLGEEEELAQRLVPAPPPIPQTGITVIAPPVGEGVQRGVEALVETARAYLSRMQHVPQAIDLLTQAVEVQPANGQAYLLLGDAYLQQDDVAQAARYYSHASRHLAPDSRPGREARLKLKVLQESVQPKTVAPVVEYAGTVSAAGMRRSLEARRTYGHAARPGCVTIYAVLAALAGILAVVVGVLVALAGTGIVSFLQKMHISLDPSLLEIYTWLTVGAGVGLGTVNVAIAAGLWRMKNRARIAAVVTNILSVLIVVCPAVALYATLSPFFTTSLLAGLPTPVWAIPLAGLALVCGATYWLATNRGQFE